MGKWLAGIAATVIAGVLIWLITRPPEPPPPAPVYSLSGIWDYRITSNVSHQTYKGTLRLVMEGSKVGGEFVEDLFDKSSKGVHGTFDGTTLELVRDTGMNTTQNFSLAKREDKRFTGRFWNVGPPENRDDGTFEITR